jgi:hypothetical protein
MFNLLLVQARDCRSWSHITTDSKSWCWVHCETCNQTLILPESCCLVFVWLPLWQEVGSVSCQSLSAVFVHCQVFLIVFSSEFYTHVLYIYIIYTRPLSAQAQYSRSCLISCSLRYNSSLNNWTVIHLTVTKFKPLKFHVAVFALPYFADITISMILYDFCLLPA